MRDPVPVLKEADKKCVLPSGQSPLISNLSVLKMVGKFCAKTKSEHISSSEKNTLAECQIKCDKESSCSDVSFKNDGTCLLSKPGCTYDDDDAYKIYGKPSSEPVLKAS